MNAITFALSPAVGGVASYSASHYRAIKDVKMADMVGLVILVAVVLFLLRLFSSGSSGRSPQGEGQVRRTAQAAGRYPVSQDKVGTKRDPLDKNGRPD